MTKQEFRNLVKQRPVILDGATGSNLMKAGMPKGVCTEQWICENPKPLQELQKAYEKAGSQIVYAPTFSANCISLKNYGLENQVEELNKALIEISRTAVGNQMLVAGDLTTAGNQETPYEELLEAYREQILVQAREGIDLLVAETMLGVTECMAALDAAASVCSLPVMCTLTVESDGSLFFGGNIYEAVETLEEMGADAVGINCSTGPDQLLSVVENNRKAKGRNACYKCSGAASLLYGSQGICSLHEIPGRRRCRHHRRLLRNNPGIHTEITRYFYALRLQAQSEHRLNRKGTNILVTNLTW